MSNRDVLLKLNDTQLAFVLMSNAWDDFVRTELHQSRELFERWLNREFSAESAFARILKLYCIMEDSSYGESI